MRFFLTWWLLIGATVRPALAVELDWNNYTSAASGSDWNYGALTGSFDIDPTNPGDDIRITFTGDTGVLAPDPNGNQTPNINTVNSGGMNPAPNSLQAVIDLSTVSQEINVSIEFLYDLGVSNVSFSIFDIDVWMPNSRFNFIDQLRDISAAGLNGTSYVSLTATNPSAVSITDNMTASAEATGVLNSPPDSDNGNVLFTFSDTGIQEILFTYGAGPGDYNSNAPTPQGISLNNISYTPVIPEPNTVIGTIVLLILAFALQIRNVYQRRMKLDSL